MKAGNAPILYFLAVIIVSLVLLGYAMRMGRDVGYRQGQIDALQGKWKYQPTTQQVIVEVGK